MTRRVWGTGALLTGLLLLSAAAARAAETDTAAVVDVQEESAQAADEQNYPDLRIRGFCDVNYSSTDDSTRLSGFRIGQFVLHFSSPLATRVRFFGETSFTAQRHNYVLEVERLLVRYEFNDLLALSAGRYHTPANFWNTAYHHGLWLQTSIDRPEIIKFGGELIPAHFVGLQAEGRFPGALGMHYQLGVGNGRDLEAPTRAGDAGENTAKRAWVAHLFARPSELFGFETGGSIYGDHVDLGDSIPIRELTLAAHFAWTREQPELIAEVARVSHRDLRRSDPYIDTAWYAQLAYRLPGSAADFKPYARYEHTMVDPSDPVVEVTAYDQEVLTLGIRYDVAVLAALKGEYRNMKPGGGGPRVNGYYLQSSFTF